MKLTQYEKGFERALMLNYGTNSIWTREELVVRRRVLRIINGRKSTRPVPKRK
jgi:hypothetical protein